MRYYVTAEGVVLAVLERFAAMPYNELLDYVYFETAPMKDVVKGKLLDFSGIPKPQRFIDPVSLLPAKLFYELREKFLQLHVSKPSALGAGGTIDAELLEFIDVLDEEGSFELPEGEVFVNDDVKLSWGKPAMFVQAKLDGRCPRCSTKRQKGQFETGYDKDVGCSWAYCHNCGWSY